MVFGLFYLWIRVAEGVGSWRGLNLWPLGYSRGSPNHYRPWWLFSSPSSLWYSVCIHSIRPRNFWGEKQSIFHPHQPQFNKWDSCFMQLIWWQSGWVGGIRSNKLQCWRREERQLKFDADELLRQERAEICAFCVSGKRAPVLLSTHRVHVNVRTPVENISP